MIRERVIEVTEELLIKRGFHSVSFREVAEVVGTTRANLHYHFATKVGLAEVVLDEYIAKTQAAYTAIWSEIDTSLNQKIEATVDFMRKRYDRYGSADDQNSSWSLTTRLYSDWDALSPRMQSALLQNAGAFEGLVRIGVALAVRSGELRSDAPQEEIVFQLTNNILLAAHITRGRHSFSRLAQVWQATWTTIKVAYGTQKPGVAPSLPATAAP